MRDAVLALAFIVEGGCFGDKVCLVLYLSLAVR